MAGDPVLNFGSYRLDVGNEQLWRETQLVRLTPKAWQVLHLLVERSGQLVTKDEFAQTVWAGTVVSDAALTSCIQELRQALEDNARTPQYIETVHRRGFRFIGKVGSSQNPVASREESSINGQEADTIMSAQPIPVLMGAGIQGLRAPASGDLAWLPASAGMTPPPSDPQNDHPTSQLEPFLGVSPLPLRRSWPRKALVLVVVVLLVGVALTVRYLSPPSTQPLTPNTQSALLLPDEPSIIVLPFVNLSGDPTQEYFSDGMTEEITSALSQIASLFVIARTSAFSYKGKAITVQEVSREMGVRYVLEGSVQKAGEQVRIVAQLIDATTGGHLWSQRYDRSLKDIFALHDDIVQKIVTTLKLQLSLQEQGYIVRKHTDNLEAYDYLMRGWEYFYRSTRETHAQARQMFEKATTLAPEYAEAHAWLGYTYLMVWIQQWDPDPQNLRQALELVQKALALDDSLPRAHRMLSLIYAYQAKYELAVAAAERAIALAPNDAESYVWLAAVFNPFGVRTVEAIELVEKAKRLNPRYPFSYAYHLGWAYSLIGRYEEAIAAQKQALLRNPNWLFSHVELFLNYRMQWSSQLSQEPQTLDRGLEAAQRTVALEAASPWGRLTLSQAYLWKKQYEQARVETERALALNPSEGRVYISLANTLSYLGRSEETLGLIEKALPLNPRLPPRALLQLGHTYYLAGRTEEAIAALKKSLNGSPADLDAHLLLAAVYSELSKETEAQAEAVAVLQINPQWSLEVWRQRVPYKDPAMLERVFAALRKAGLK